MRLLLTAMTSVKGAVAENLLRHLELLEEARRKGCDLAVFPEFSLTGSIDPRTHPERAITLHNDSATSLVDATASSGVAALFGLAERDGPDVHITQAYAAGGTLLGVCRKRHLGEGEDAFTVGETSGGFAFGSARLGVVICAEGGVDRIWAEAAHSGAGVVLFCSAPGLYGRRTDETSWASGYAWWEECGLGDAIRQARARGLWVAMSTQAGSTEDEDFPGIAALVSPSGDVVARLPDWRPGTLVVDVPVETAVSPAREAVRVLVLDDDTRALLVCFTTELGRASWWAPPGGGLQAGESHVAAARRELAEELDRSDLVLGPSIGWRTHTFWWDRMTSWVTQRERWLLCRTSAFDVADTHVAGLRSENITEVRWWSAAEIRDAGVITVPRDLPARLERIAAGEVPDGECDLGV
jgi:predicted amidohydrolase